MNYFQIIVLAIIQGLAELLPVSSSAHVILAEKLMGMKDASEPDMVFLLVMLHTGTMFAVLCYFWPRWKAFLLSQRPNPEVVGAGAPAAHFIKMLILATAITGVLGLGLAVGIEKVVFQKLLNRPEAKLEDLFKNLPLMAGALFAVGVFIILAGTRKTVVESESLDMRSTIWIGVVQGLCLPFRGFSRSGATISTGLFRGLSRRLAEDFSFALAVLITPPVLLYSLYKVFKEKDKLAEEGKTILELLKPGLVGMVFSFLAGLIALRFLSTVLENGRWKYFGYYCIGFAVLVAAVAFSDRF